jgi:hypothetical protein
MTKSGPAPVPGRGNPRGAILRDSKAAINPLFKLFNIK